ncbi:hypothetical protein LXL04_024751 [Taraxacum kok-saghyz]
MHPHSEHAPPSHTRSIVAHSHEQMEGSQKTTYEAESVSEKPPIVDVEEDEEVADNRGGGHKKSWVWDHFDQEALKKGAKKLKCPYCTTEFLANMKKNGTSAMGSHRLIDTSLGLSVVID